LKRGHGQHRIGLPLKALNKKHDFRFTVVFDAIGQLMTPPA